MRHSKKLLALLLAAALALGMLAGCGEEPAAESAAPPSEEPVAGRDGPAKRRTRRRAGRAPHAARQRMRRSLDFRRVLYYYIGESNRAHKAREAEDIRWIA